MDDELENFIRERKARVAEDKASLEQDPPYMEIKAKPHRSYGSTIKENIPPRPIVEGKEESNGMGLPLGVEYERKKQRLQHELRMDYRRYMAQKKQFDPVQLGSLIHLDDRRSVKQPLLEGRVADLLRQRPPSRRDAATLTEDSRTLHGALHLSEKEERSSVLPWHRSRPTKNDSEFATGLRIGAADADEVSQRRKQCYRQELQEQIAEQHRNRKREKDLELKVAATGANDPEKQPDRIRQFGLSRRNDPWVSEPSATGESEQSSRGVSNEKTPPPDPPRVAFQSPLLEYSSALGLQGGGLSPNILPAAPSFPRAMDTSRIPLLLPPHPPSTLGEAYRNPYAEPHHYYSTRNPFDPNMAYCGHLSVPGAGLPVSYWNVPPGQFGNHSPHSQHSGSSFPEPPIQPSNDAAAAAAAADSHAGLFPPDRSGSTRERIYRDALKQQIQEQQERRRLEREERERYEAQLEADMKNHQPWGRGGGGAPLRDSTGNLIADLNQMHKLNEEAYSNPEQWQRRATAARRVEHPDPNERVSGFTHVQTPQFARGNVFSNQPSLQQLQEQDKYKAYLKQQIEEKLRKKAEERERMRLEEEREEKRLEEQRARIQREFEEEQDRKRQKEREQKAKNEELIQLAEQRKKEVEKKKKEEEENESVSLRRQYERERQARVEETHREPSPPIPTLQKRHGLPQYTQYTPRPPTVDSRHSTAPLSERSLSGLQSPPVPACRNQLRAAEDQRDVFSELSVLRRQLRNEQKRLEGRLHQADWEELDSPLSDRHRERPPVDVFDMARLRLQAPVRRPSSRNAEPRNLRRIHDSLQLKYTDSDFRLQSSEVPKLEEVGVASRRRRDYRDPYQPLSSQRSTAQDDYLDLSPPHQTDYLRSAMGGSTRGSLLESDSAFIDPLGDDFPVPHTPDLEKTPQLSARERRRRAKQSQQPRERAASSQHGGRPGAQTANGLQQDTEPGGVGRSRDRAGRLAHSRHGNTAGPADLSDDDSSSPLFSPYNFNRQSSVETVATDPWMRPGTSDMIKCLDRPSRRERLKM